jgi:hypothetical protein
MSTIKLKRTVKSKKFGITFPSNTPLSFFKSEDKFFAEHPTYKNVYIRVSHKNIVNQ